MASGIPKAMVLPEPVGARPQRSRPAQPSATVRVWMAKGARIPRAFSVETSSAGTPRSAKVVVMEMQTPVFKGSDRSHEGCTKTRDC